MKNPKQRAQKRPAKASRTTTKQAAMKDNNRGLDGLLRLVTSKQAPHEIPELDLQLYDSEIFDIPDSILEEVAVSEEIAATITQQDVTPTVKASKSGSQRGTNEVIAVPAQSKAVSPSPSPCRQ